MTKETNYIDEDGNYVEVSWLDESEMIAHEMLDNLSSLHDILDRESEFIQTRLKELRDRLETTDSGKAELSLSRQIVLLEESQERLNEYRFDVAYRKEMVRVNLGKIVTEADNPSGFLDPEDKDEWVTVYRAQLSEAISTEIEKDR